MSTKELAGAGRVHPLHSGLASRVHPASCSQLVEFTPLFGGAHRSRRGAYTFLYDGMKGKGPTFTILQ